MIGSVKEAEIAKQITQSQKKQAIKIRSAKQTTR
jgi:hypothetical protein